MSDTKPIPHNFQAEQAVLGAIIQNDTAVWEVHEILKAEDFHTEKNRRVYEAVVHLQRTTQQCDPLTIDTHLRRKSHNGVSWVDYTKELIQHPPDVKSAVAYARIVAEMAQRRKMISLSKQVGALAYDQTKPIDEQMSRVESLAFGMRNGHASSGIQTSKQTIATYRQNEERLRNHTGKTLGIPTGWKDLDRILDGLQSELVYVLAGRPAMGKSSAAMNIADRATIKDNKHVVFFSLEMGHDQLIVRRLSGLTGIDTQAIKRPWERTESERIDINLAMEKLEKSPLYVDDTPGMTPSKIYARCMRQKAMYGLDLIIIDHFHKMRSDVRRNRKDLELDEMMSRLPEIAKFFNVPVLLLAQLNRGVENRADKRPGLADLRETGSIEEHADVVMFIYRDEYYNPDTTETPNQAEIKIAKHRGGPVGLVKLFWKARTTQFCNLATKEIGL